MTPAAAAPETTQDARTCFLVLLSVKVRGFATAGAVAEGTGLPEDLVQSTLNAAGDQGQAKYREGRITGWTLTGPGRARLSELREECVSPSQTAALEEAYDAFLAPNATFKQLTTDWQMKSDDSQDAELGSRLDALHEQALAVLTTASTADQRFENYARRLTTAVTAFRAGDKDALARPMTGSYHDVWMELHEDLITVLGRERTEADG